MELWDRTVAVAESQKKAIAVISVGTVALISFIDWKVQRNLSLGALYLIPILLAATALDKTRIIAFAAVCSWLRELFSPFHLQPGALPRVAIVFGAFSVGGVLVSEMSRNRRLERQRSAERDRHLAFEQASGDLLRALIETNPLAIVVLEADGTIVVANASASELFGTEAAERENIRAYVPALASVGAPGKPVVLGTRTEIECRGRTKDGRVFLARAWFSVFGTDAAPRIACVIWDASEELRDRQAAGLESLLTTSRVVVASFAHEVRNLTAAAAASLPVIENAAETIAPREFGALRGALKALEQLAASGLRVGSRASGAVMDLNGAMDEVRIVIEPLLKENEVCLNWDIPDSLPTVHGDENALLHVFINLARNSSRALIDSPRRVVSIHGVVGQESVVIRVEDTGQGVANPQELFRPFQSSAASTGLGLYVSRGMLRAFGGDLTFEDTAAGGACFVVHLRRAKA